jgi:branched-chain amino acid transport system substrate-binding protein
VRSRVPALLLFALSGALVATSAPVGAQTTGSTVPTGSPVRIGLQGPLTGSQQAYGQGMLKGAQLAAERLNAEGGILGRKVEVVPIDDQADPATGVVNATAAIRAGLDGVIGPYNSGVGALTLPLYIQAGLVPARFTTADSTDGLGITLQPMTSQIAPVAADALTEWLRVDSVALVFDATALYTQKQAEAMRKELEAAGVRISAFEPIQPGLSSYAATIAKVGATKPDAVYLVAYYPEAGLIAKEMHQAKVPAQCLADFGAYSVDFVTTAGKAAARACPVVGVPAPDEFTGAAPYLAAYRKRFGEAPGVWGPYAYDSLAFLAAAVTKAGTWEAAALTRTIVGFEGFRGWTGRVRIAPVTGNREPATVVVLRADRRGTLRVDRGWQKAVGTTF